MTDLLLGRNAVREALVAHRRTVHQIMLVQGVGEKGIIAEILTMCRQRRIPVEYAQRRDMDRLAGPVKHQGIAARTSSYPYSSMEEMLLLAKERSEQPFLLALDSLQDPQNVGSLLRSAEAVGVHGVLLPDRRSAQVTAAVTRASVGAVEHLRIAQVTNLARAMDELKELGLWAVGIEELTTSIDYRQVDLNMPLVIVMGSEGQGMRRLIVEKCDWLLRIPMRGQINSLNVSVAGSIALYQVLNSRQENRQGAQG